MPNLNDFKKDNDITIDISATIGCANLKIHQLLKLERGAVVELDRSIDDKIDIYANNVLIGYGEIVITNEEFIGISVTEIIK
ncbi:MAG: FliM/FliN family flagellar motor switch protein [Alphaproteobacteria bacterium]|nr:FliM/FliN family flagellar motor switch protein [Alphaproteobacteria bacterium]